MNPGFKFFIGACIVLTIVMTINLVIFEMKMRGPVQIEPRTTKEEAKALECIEVHGLLVILLLFCIFTWR